MKNLNKLLAVSLVALSVQTIKLVEADESQFEENMRNAEAVYNRQEAERERERYQEYLRNHDRESGIGQQSGPTGGRSSDGEGYWGGYRWSTE